MPRYKYASAHEWLLENLDNLGEGVERKLVSMLDADDIQDVFQAEMDADGYFDDLDAPTEEVL